MTSAPADDTTQDPVEALIARLYRNVLAVPPADYREWALREVAQVIACDGALWGSGSATSPRFHIATVLGLPKDFPQRLEATASINPLLPRVLENLEQPVDLRSVMSGAAYHASPIYREVFGPLGIEHILSTAHRDARSGLYSLVTLYRRDATDVFTPLERARQQRITFHLFNAASHGFFVHLLRRTDATAGRGAAVVDARGALHEVQPRFHELLDAHFPAHAGAGLPFALPAPGSTQRHGALCLHCDALGELFVLQLWPAGPLDHLTAREREVVNAVAQGLTFKQAGRRIGVAPSTVANHLYRIYRKLGVNSRAELAKLVYAP